MFGISHSSRIDSVVRSASSTADLTLAQQQTLKTFPPSLAELVKRGVVTAEWALALPKWRRYSLGSQQLCDLLANYTIKPADIAKNFNELQLHVLETRASVCTWLSTGVLPVERFSTLNRDQLNTLVEPGFQAQLNRFEIQLKLNSNRLKLQDLMQEFRAESTDSSSSSSSSSSVSSSSSSSASSTSGSGSLTSAQQQKCKMLPCALTDLIAAEVVTLEWALSLPDHLLKHLSKINLCDLLADHIIEPVDITDHFTAVHLIMLEYSPITRQMLRAKYVSAKEFAQYKSEDLELIRSMEAQRIIKSMDPRILG